MPAAVKSQLTDIIVRWCAKNIRFVDVLNVSCPTIDWVQTELLSFWESKSQQWTKLGRVARGLLGIPAADTSSESFFHSRMDCE